MDGKNQNSSLHRQTPQALTQIKELLTEFDIAATAEWGNAPGFDRTLYPRN